MSRTVAAIVLAVLVTLGLSVAVLLSLSNAEREGRHGTVVLRDGSTFECVNVSVNRWDVTCAGLGEPGTLYDFDARDIARVDLEYGVAPA